MKPTRRTGPVIVRDYGTTIKGSNGSVFVSPARYAAGALLLADQNDVDALVTDYAKRHHIPLQEAQDTWLRGMRNHLSIDGMTVHDGKNISKVGHYNGQFTAEAVNRRNPADPHNIKLGVNYSLAHCPCPDDFWNGTKTIAPKEYQSICAHTAALSIVLAMDKKERAHHQKKLTNLAAKELAYASALPYRLTQDVVSDMLFSYMGGALFRDISAEAFRNPAFYTKQFVQGLEHGAAQFMVLPQAPKVVKRELLSETEDRFLGACEELEERIARGLKADNFVYEGRSLVFKGSSHQAVAKRFSRGDLIFELIRAKNQPPLIVRKELGDFIEDWYLAKDAREDAPTGRGEYTSVDDATRRLAITEIRKPGVNYLVHVPTTLQSAYRKL